MDVKINKNQIKEYFDLPTLGQTTRQREFVAEDTCYTSTIPMVNPAYIFGIEVEVEGVPDPRVQHTHRSYWNLTMDNSLRNNGIEFVSVPLRAEQVEFAMIQLNASLPDTASFSARTSVHVHMNVRDMVIDQIKGLMLLYTAVEELLFDWAGEERVNNVFCVRLTDTDYAQTYRDFCNDPRQVVHYWNKYTAMNLHPMESKGTVEFRHMAGTADIIRVATWVNILSCLKVYTKKHSSTDIMEQIHQLNSTSEYEMFLIQVFQEYTKELIPRKFSIQEKMENAVSYIKLTNIAKDVEQTTVPDRAIEPVRRRPAEYDMLIMDEVTAHQPQTTTENQDNTIQGELNRRDRLAAMAEQYQPRILPQINAETRGRNPIRDIPNPYREDFLRVFGNTLIPTTRN